MDSRAKARRDGHHHRVCVKSWRGGTSIIPYLMVPYLHCIPSSVPNRARISPGNPRGPLAAATRPLRHLILNVTLDSPIARYYTKEQNSIATTMYAQLPMPWGIQSKKAVSPTTQTDWPRSSRLYSHFDHPNDVSVNGVPTILSDPYPDWMPPELAHYRSTAEASGDAYETVNKRFNTITPRRAAAWVSPPMEDGRRKGRG